MCLNRKSVKTEKKEISYKGKNTDDKTFNRKDRKVKQGKNEESIESILVTYERVWYYTHTHMCVHMHS